MSDDSPRPALPRWAWAAPIVLLVASAALGFSRGRREKGPPSLSRLPEFSLLERSGRPLTSSALRGRTWVADFIFTSCGGTCPAMTARMARLRKEVPEDVVFVSFTVDPDHDTPEVLTRYAESFQADDRWLFATGPKSALHDLSVSGFKLAAMEVPPDARQQGGDGPFLHSNKFVLVDAVGAIRGYYDSADEDAMRALVRDVRRVREGA